MDLTDDNMCFACGEDNPISLGLVFALNDKKEAVAEFMPGREHQGYRGIMHGGLVSTLLDEAMAKAVVLNGQKAVTAEMTARFKQPVPVDKKVIVKGILNKKRGKLIYTESSLEDSGGTVFARAEAKFIAVTGKD